jgi:hypothetical protein
MPAFAVSPLKAAPWVSEYTHNFSTPDEYESKILSKTVVDTGGLTGLAFSSHHTISRTPLSLDMTQSLLRTARGETEAAQQELKDTCVTLYPVMDAIRSHLLRYSLYETTSAGLITSLGFVECCTKAGVKVSRDEFLSLERATKKDRLGRLFYEDALGLVAAHGSFAEE